MESGKSFLFIYFRFTKYNVENYIGRHLKIKSIHLFKVYKTSDGNILKMIYKYSLNNLTMNKLLTEIKFVDNLGRFLFMIKNITMYCVL